MELLTDSNQVFDTLNLDPSRLLAMQAIMDCLQYPVAPDETVIEVGFVSATIAYHLARCGFGIVRPPLIQKRKVSGPGIIVGACHWVGIDESADPMFYSSPLDDLENLTFAQVDALPEPLRSEARKRLGLPYDEPGWQHKPNVKIEDAPDDVDDGAEWIRE